MLIRQLQHRCICFCEKRKNRTVRKYIEGMPMVKGGFLEKVLT